MVCKLGNFLEVGTGVLLCAIGFSQCLGEEKKESEIKLKGFGCHSFLTVPMAFLAGVVKSISQTHFPECEEPVLYCPALHQRGALGINPSQPFQQISYNIKWAWSPEKGEATIS